MRSVTSATTSSGKPYDPRNRGNQEGQQDAHGADLPGKISKPNPVVEQRPMRRSQTTNPQADAIPTATSGHLTGAEVPRDHYTITHQPPIEQTIDPRLLLITGPGDSHSQIDEERELISGPVTAEQEPYGASTTERHADHASPAAARVSSVQSRSRCRRDTSQPSSSTAKFPCISTIPTIGCTLSPSYYELRRQKMSSSPMTPGTRSGSHDDQSPPLSSPASSPPPIPESDKEDVDYDPKAEAMRREEERLAKETQRKQRKSPITNKIAQDAGADAKNYEKLEWFMSQSKGFSSAIMDQLKQALSFRSAETTPQPKLISGGKMRDYQLEGLTWLACLYEVGLNGILADEMGLGKTVQLISFLAFLREHGTNGPFLILGPLSTVTNWVNEFQRWAPKIPVVMYHGNPQVRGQIRRQQLKGDPRGDKFPVVCTSYEICMRDKKYLANYHWKFIVVVGHCPVSS
ncbi:MAG: hypothetical protein Q9168_007963 [Polycauliona sp. 1 TL-2023]